MILLMLPVVFFFMYCATSGCHFVMQKKVFPVQSCEINQPKHNLKHQNFLFKTKTFYFFINWLVSIKKSDTGH